VIELFDVTQHYGVRPVLRGISLRIERGEVVTILGPNGMGKSTLLGVMAGVLSPQRGTVLIDGFKRRGSEEDELAIRKMVYEGLRRGFDHFPWKHFETPTADSDLTAGRGPSGMWGWPYDRMLREVVGDQSISRIDAILCCMLGSWPLSVALLRAWRVPLDFSLPIATGLILLVALITPPRLKRWRLTGQHRIVHAMSFATAQAGSKVAKFVKVG
jgi:energy-coupling factor transporter ATP-binding protein EcfA2